MKKKSSLDMKSPGFATGAANYCDLKKRNFVPINALFLIMKISFGL